MPEGGPAVGALTPSLHADGQIVVSITGELDISNADELRAQFESILASNPDSLVIDVGALKFMDSSGIALLVQVATRVGSVSLRNPSALIRRVLEATGVATLLGVKK
jgi:anti-sigma B factor antagonist